MIIVTKKFYFQLIFFKVIFSVTLEVKPPVLILTVNDLGLCTIYQSIF